MTDLFKKKTPVHLSIFDLKPSPGLIKDELIIPTNLLDNHCASRIEITCPLTGSNRKMPLMIHPDAFVSTKNSTEFFLIFECDLRRFDFSFLAGFNKLLSLSIINASHVERARWIGMSALPVLEMLEISSDETTDWNKWSNHLPKLTNGLVEVELLDGFGFIGDEIADRIVQWLLDSSIETLANFRMLGTALSRIPTNLSLFKQLAIIIFSCRKSVMMVIKENSFRFSYNPITISIESCRIEKIEPGAFQG